jgi:type IV secretion system protein VirB6
VHADAHLVSLTSLLGLDPKMSCIITPGNNILLANESLTILTSPKAAWIKSKFSMTSPLAEGGKPDEIYSAYFSSYDGKNPTRCDQPSLDVKFMFNEKLYTLNAEDTVIVPVSITGDLLPIYKNAPFRAKVIADKICVQTIIGIDWVVLGCKPTIYINRSKIADNDITGRLNIAVGPTSFDIEQLKKTHGCAIAPTCTDVVRSHSRSLFPFTSLMMECMTDSMSAVFKGTSCGNENIPFKNFQDKMRNIVRLVLTLYVMFFAIKIMMGREEPKKADIFMFIIKLVLVMYFSVGIYFQDHSGVSRFEDGVTSFFLPAFQGAAISLGNMMVQAGQANKLCAFIPSDYDSITRYERLAIWDSIDCRIAYYLGLTSPIPDVPSSRASMYILWCYASIMSGQIFLAIFSIFFAVAVISIVIYLSYMFILSMFGMTIMAFFAPIFVPLVLFQQTKTYFDSWLKLFLGFTLRPMVLTVYIALMFTVFDQTIYGDCEFDKKLASNFAEDSGFNSTGFLFQFNAIKSGKDSPCQKSPGYQLSNLQQDIVTTASHSTNLGPFKVFVLNNEIVTSLSTATFKLFLMGFLFWYFTRILSMFIDDMSGGFNHFALNVPMAPQAFASLASKAIMPKLSTPPAPKLTQTKTK